MALTSKDGPEVGSFAEGREVTENVRLKRGSSRMGCGCFCWAELEKASEFLKLLLFYNRSCKSNNVVL